MPCMPMLVYALACVKRDLLCVKTDLYAHVSVCPVHTLLYL